MTFQSDLARFSKDLEKKIETATGDTTMGELFPDSFMKQRTSLKSINDLFAAVGVTEAGDVEKVVAAVLDKKVAELTEFSSWDEMKARALEELIIRRLK